MKTKFKKSCLYLALLCWLIGSICSCFLLSGCSTTNPYITPPPNKPSCELRKEAIAMMTTAKWIHYQYASNPEACSPDTGGPAYHEAWAEWYRVVIDLLEDKCDDR
jgi:hypothetical protein